MVFLECKRVTVRIIIVNKKLKTYKEAESTYW
jgi:hypothetical protein